MNTIIDVFIAPIWPVALTLLYYDTRVRVEGLDIALRTVNVPDPGLAMSSRRLLPRIGCWRQKTWSTWVFSRGHADLMVGLVVLLLFRRRRFRFAGSTGF